MLMMWLTRSVTKINVALQLLDITSQRPTQYMGIYKYYVLRCNI